MSESNPGEESVPALAPLVVATEEEEQAMKASGITCPKCTQEWLRGRRGLSAGAGVTRQEGTATMPEATFLLRAFCQGLFSKTPGGLLYDSALTGCESHKGLF
jgi:hypothetical protein